MSFPEPTASVSTPLQKINTQDLNYTRPRRHTITRPDSALAMLSDLEDVEDEDEEQQRTFDRISGILSNLIKEANEAVNGIEQERVLLLKSAKKNNNDHLFTSSTIITKTKQDTVTSKIPRPRKSRLSITPSHSRNPSSSSVISSTSTLVNSPTSMCRSPSPTSINFRRFRSPINTTRRSITPKRNKSVTASDPIIESYKRLDSSMALVESLSRDLATPKNGSDAQQQGLDTRLTILLLIPLLHIPHSLITMVFDFIFNQNSTTTTAPSTSNKPLFNFTTMIFWACVFAVTNLMVDQAVIPNTKNYFMQKVRRISLPGSYKQEKKKSKQPILPPTASTVPVKRTWIPTTIQKQYQFRLGEDISPPQVRRNSI